MVTYSIQYFQNNVQGHKHLEGWATEEPKNVVSQGLNRWFKGNGDEHKYPRNDSNHHDKWHEYNADICKIL